MSEKTLDAKYFDSVIGQYYLNKGWHIIHRDEKKVVVSSVKRPVKKQNDIKTDKDETEEIETIVSKKKRGRPSKKKED